MKIMYRHYRSCHLQRIKDGNIFCYPTICEGVWALWCGTCRMIHPIVDQLEVQILQIQHRREPNHGIRSVPTVIIFKDGEKKDSIIGAVPR
ncbi:hypothetical protein CARUB_v10015005mg [Capsella rubella]|uniref:Thioredoxin domain-containing protein n=1 Tax=Capsella rubella TaxID=81985 RepID=R0I5X3_9BRAS|nr:hypothetical protein CARUB_v10015005mg [Capsella rubella]